MASNYWIPVFLSGGAICALTASDFRGWRPGRYLFKPLAALAFLWLAWTLGALDSGYGQWLFGGLLLCAAGDLLLMPESDRSFLAGLFAFLSGHLLYALSFFKLGHDPVYLALAALPAAVLLLGVARWLKPVLPADMKIPVALYMSVISGMLLCAGGTGNMLIITGAWGFALSDLAVSRDRFVQADRNNALWGTPLYFVSQMILASSVAWS